METAFSYDFNFSQSRQINQTPESEKTMEVCNVCGALLVVGDIQQRIDEHIMGKQHSGYARIRTYVEERKQVSKLFIFFSPLFHVSEYLTFKQKTIKKKKNSVYC